MRFRKKISIAKGLGINVSKSGLSMSAGIPGLSLTAGKRGLYVNAGIPGTGIYDRQRIGGSSKASSKPANQSKSTVSTSVDIHIDDEGNATFILPDGTPIQDTETINRIKRMPEFKGMVATEKRERTSRLANEAVAKNRESEEIINIANYAATVKTEKQFSIELEELTQKEPSALEQYEIPEPDKRAISAELERRATAEITSIFSKKKKVMMFVCDNLEKDYAAAMTSWKNDKENYEKEQMDRQTAEAEYNAKAYEATKEFLANALRGDENFIINSTEAWLESIQLSLDFAVEFEFNAEQGRILIDLDLPEIQDLPDEIIIQQANGQLKSKKKTQLKLQEDYATCVFGFALFFACSIFNISPALESALISGYTQRRNKSGDLISEYIYSIDFSRSDLENKDISAASPIEICMESKSRCSISKTFVLKNIEPFEK